MSIDTERPAASDPVPQDIHGQPERSSLDDVVDRPTPAPESDDDTEGQLPPTSQNDPDDADDAPALSDDELSILGLTQADIAGIDPDTIRLAAGMASRSIGQMLNQFNSQPPSTAPPAAANQWGQPWGAASAAAGAPAPPQQQMPNQFQEPAGYKLELNKEEYGEELVDNLQKMVDHFNQRDAAMRQQLAQSQQIVADQQRSAMAAEFDSFVSQLGEDYEPVFGKGAWDQLNQASPAMASRTQAFQLAETLSQIHPHVRRDAIFRMAVNSLTGNLGQSATQRLSQELRNRSKQTIGRPSRKQSSAADNEPDPNNYNLSRKSVRRLQRFLDERRARNQAG